VKRVLDYMEQLTQRERKQRWATPPAQKPASQKPQLPTIPEDDADLLAYREELLSGGDSTEGE
jgi:hypothetical protein